MKWLFALALLLSGSATLGGGELPSSDETNEQRLFIITLDGYRWQELFGGADETIIRDPKYTADTAFTRALYWDADPQRRRERLMPFFWNVIAKQGQLHGNRRLGNFVNTSNLYGISYPGYNEIFTGSPDLFISTNEKVRNQNRNVLEQLAADPALNGRVAAFASWDVMPYILNRDRSGFYLNAGAESVQDEGIGEGQKQLNRLLEHPENAERATRDDRITFLSALDYVRRHKPRVFYLGFSGTDDAGHEKSYDRYLRSANEADRMIGELWAYLQSDPEYRGRTTLLITTDHGRGDNPRNWSGHGFFVGGSSQTWMALLGNAVQPMGECADQRQLYQKQVAATIAVLMGKRSTKGAGLPLTFFRGTEPSAWITAR
ncbi:phosphoglyceromutase [Flaviaesturariibacter flavus]|uniref:Phosphoglyceromutase n=1 Tax=Flaviaesturariibacter flavus TaxID=2502780 RepID=A0A4V2NV46_9BACT|nr:alkaline phosphatase family protein [Flaviaesturariibacter flavus]TCJ12056.1 phosphoglyceromutase [Flaviaesturariibacter flavus]